MQQLVYDMKEMEGVLVPFCHDIMKWDTIKLYEDIQEIVQPMTNMVMIVLNNKELFAQLGIDIQEEAILSVIENISNALEKKDDVLLLDGVYHGYLPCLNRIREKITVLL